MQTLTAILTCSRENAPAVEAALLEVVAHVKANEPETLGYHVARGTAEDGSVVFTTYERFADAAAMERHNGSSAVARFFETAGPLLSGPATVATAEEIAVK
jgi:quinol monooxygenase YgiN